MSDRSIARRYASALYEEASSREVIDKTDVDVDFLHETLKASRELRMLLASPVVNAEKKEAILRRLFEPHVSGLTLNFLVLATRKRREPLLGLILEAYRALRLEQRGIVEARARIALSMDEESVAQLREAVARVVGKEVVLEVEEDPEILGGIVVKVGDTVYDGSLRRQLSALQEQLRGGSFQNN